MISSDDEMTALFESLDSRNGATPSKPIPPQPEHRHPCLECSGTGIYRGVRVHQPKSECFACKGKGYFQKSYADRMKAKQRRNNRKEAALSDKQAEFTKNNEGLIERLTEIASWHSFANEMLVSFKKWGSLTDKQTAACWAAVAKVEAKRAEREKEKAAKSGEVSMESIEKMFATAVANGLQRPRFITDRLTISRAKDHSRNPGAIYVKCDGVYAGKIVAGKLLAVREAPADILKLVQSVAIDPVEAARAYGRATGTCACCGRELKDPVSVENGIGPVCESNWF